VTQYVAASREITTVSGILVARSSRAMTAVDGLRVDISGEVLRTHAAVITREGG
jgi:hypothetical protein